MASLLNSFAEAMTPDMLGKLGQAVGVNPSQAQQGMSIVGPVLLGSLAHKSQTTSGLDSIMRMLPEETGGGGFLSRLMGSMSNPLASASMLSNVLGPGVSSIGKALSGRLGFNAAPLLATAAPAMLGAISQTAKSNKLNSADIATMLQQETKETLATASPDIKSAVDEAFKVGNDAEQLKARFTDTEWRQIRMAPVAATLYIASASPSGITGLAKEVMTSGETMQSIVKDAAPTSLVDVAYGSAPTKPEMDDESGFEKDAPRETLLTALHTAAAAVKAKCPSDSRSFTDTMVALSHKVAEASKEGGFLGIGGTRVSKEEEQAIADITSAVA